MITMVHLIYFYAFVFFLRGVNYNSESQLEVYKVRSGIVYYSSVMNIAPFNKGIVLYFDSFGKREAIKITATISNSIQTQMLIKLDDLQYMMMDTLQCIKTKRKKEFSLENLDISLINENTCKEYDVKAAGEIFYLNRMCNKYIFTNSGKNIKGEIIVWQNIPLSILVDRQGIVERTEAYKIETEVNIDENVFDIPKNIKILDMTSIDNN